MNNKAALLTINGVAITTLNPEASCNNARKTKDDFDDANNASLTMKITFRKVSFLLGGDIAALTQKRLLETGADLKSDVLFVPHQGGGFLQYNAFS